MNNKFKPKRYLFVILLALVAMPMFFSCSDDDDNNVVDKTTFYTIGFSEINMSGLREVTIIDSTYKHNIGVTDDEFTLEGSQSDNDKKVAVCCQKAQQYLKTLTFSGYYVLNVARGSNVIHTATYGSK